MTPTQILAATPGAALVAPFYDSINLPHTKDVEALVKSVTHPDWISYGGEDSHKGRDGFIGLAQVHSHCQLALLFFFCPCDNY